MTQRQIDSVMLHSIEEKMNEAELAREKVLSEMKLLNQKYDIDSTHVERRLRSIEEWKKYTTRGLIVIMAGIILSVAASISGMVIAQQNNSANDELVKLMITEIKLLRQDKTKNP